MSKDNIINEIIKVVNTNKNVTKERDYKREKYRYTNVYAPIVDVINDGVVPGNGYEGLSYRQVSIIIEIIDKNIHYLESKFGEISWVLKEELIYESGNEEAYYYKTFDEEKIFLDFILYQYNKSKKKLNLKFDSSCMRNYWIKEKVRMIRKITYGIFK